MSGFSYNLSPVTPASVRTCVAGADFYTLNHGLYPEPCAAATPVGCVRRRPTREGKKRSLNHQPKSLANQLKSLANQPESLANQLKSLANQPESWNL